MYSTPSKINTNYNIFYFCKYISGTHKSLSIIFSGFVSSTRTDVLLYFIFQNHYIRTLYAINFCLKPDISELMIYYTYKYVHFNHFGTSVDYSIRPQMNTQVRVPAVGEISWPMRAVPMWLIAFYLYPVPIKNECGHSWNTLGSSGVLAFIDVHFQKNRLWIFGRKHFKMWGYALAWTTPMAFK